jgi:hypothetical protein
MSAAWELTSTPKRSAWQPGGEAHHLVGDIQRPALGGGSLPALPSPDCSVGHHACQGRQPLAVKGRLRQTPAPKPGSPSSVIRLLGMNRFRIRLVKGCGCSSCVVLQDVFGCRRVVKEVGLGGAKPNRDHFTAGPGRV